MMQADLNRLVERPADDRRLDVVPAPDAIRDRTGLERKVRSGAELQTEEITATSTDGLFTFVVRVVIG